MIKFVSVEPAFGFRLKKEFKCDGLLAVLTGKNGMGKTRFLKSLETGETKSYIDGQLVQGNEVRYLSHEDIKPRVEGEFNYVLFERQAKDTANYFEADKAAFVNEFDGMKVLGAGANMHEYQRLSYQDLHALSRRISVKLGRPVCDLVADDIERNFELPMQGAFGGAAIARICNMYLWEKKKNREMRWRALDGDKNLIYVGKDKEDEHFGVAPWVTLNGIISRLFNGKFGLSSPTGESPDFNPQLLAATGEVVSVESLSSGERGLLFFALTLFNVQYGEKLRYSVPRLLAIDEPDVHLHPQMVSQMHLVLNEFVKKFGVHIVISTHSPTTVALAPEGCVYVLIDGEVNSRSKQSAVRELLVGVERVTVIADTKRQVFVESKNDVFIYEALYSHISNQPGYDASGVELVFLPSGDGVPNNTVFEALKIVFAMKPDDDKAKEFVRVLNGGGCRTKVEWAVNRLAEADNLQVCGLIDWDNGNKSNGKIRVLAEGEAYTIENLVYDPLCVMLYLNHELGRVKDKYSNENVCGKNVGWQQWLYDSALRQEVVDRFLKSILGKDSEGDVDMVYTSGFAVRTDSAYLRLSKVELKAKLFGAYIELKKLVEGQGVYKDLGCVLVGKSMLGLADGKFIPTQFAKVFVDLHAI